jgi:hypothetical protein
MKLVSHVSAIVPALLLVGLAQANIVVNGSFEDPVVTNPIGFDVYPQGSTAITGWTVTAPNAGQGVDVVNAVLFNDTGWAFQGVQSIDLAGSPGRGGVQQLLPTITGDQYVLTFALSSNSGQPITGGVSAYWNGVLLETLTSPAFGTWQQFTYNIAGGAGSNTLLSFEGNVDGVFGTLLDDVSVVLVPSPSAAAVVGLAGLVATRRRR